MRTPDDPIYRQEMLARRRQFSRQLRHENSSPLLVLLEDGLRVIGWMLAAVAGALLLSADARILALSAGFDSAAVPFFLFGVPGVAILWYLESLD